MNGSFSSHWIQPVNQKTEGPVEKELRSTKSAGQTGRWEDYCHEGSLSLRVLSSSFYAREGGGGGGTEVRDNWTSGLQ